MSADDEELDFTALLTAAGGASTRPQVTPPGSLTRTNHGAIIRVVGGVTCVVPGVRRIAGSAFRKLAFIWPIVNRKAPCRKWLMGPLQKPGTHGAVLIVDDRTATLSSTKL